MNESHIRQAVRVLKTGCIQCVNTPCLDCFLYRRCAFLQTALVTLTSTSNRFIEEEAIKRKYAKEYLCIANVPDEVLMEVLL